ncbi:MAG TPA: autotransporter outer membrane beta-barrel domain-containing protein [Stellaceae bacterium]|nr:autotransporter outer membrane beta-barrel domain-containing protein [Stellaceae bacterium]
MASRRRMRLIWLVLAGALGLPRAAGAQIAPPYSVATGLPEPTGLVTLPGLNTAQQTMAQSIDRVCPTITNIAATPAQRDLANICQAMTYNAVLVQGQPNPLGLQQSFGLNVTGLKDALQELNGGVELLVPTNQATTLQTEQSNFQSGVIEARLSHLRERMSGTAVASAADNQLAALGAQYASSGLPVSDVPPAYVSAWYGRLGMFFDGVGQFGDSASTARQNGYSFGNGGFLTGLDYQFSTRLAAGLAFGYSHNSVDFDVTPQSASGQFLRSDLFQGNLYATYLVNPSFYLNGAASIGGGNSDSRRHIVIPSTTSFPSIDRFATGSFGNSNYGASLGGGYIVPLAPWTLTATARFQYFRTSADAFAENGALGADLRFGSSARNAFLSFIGGQAQYTIATRWGPLSPMVRFEWAHQYNSDNTAVSVAYSEDPALLSAFVLPGNPTSHNYVDLGVGAALQFSPTASGFFAYDAIVGLNHTSFNSVIGGIRIRF